MIYEYKVIDSSKFINMKELEKAVNDFGYDGWKIYIWYPGSTLILERATENHLFVHEQKELKDTITKEKELATDIADLLSKFTNETGVLIQKIDFGSGFDSENENRYIVNIMQEEICGATRKHNT